MASLPKAFLDRPIAHRGYHDPAAGRIENSRAAVQAAVDAGYGIEIDLQLSSDGHAMVFHDDVLDRLTSETGPIVQRTAADLGSIKLRGADETIPSFKDILALVSGKAPLLVEIKDQDGAMGPSVGALERAAIEALTRYDGPVALMSFNPHSVAALADLAPELPRGLTTCDYEPVFWPMLTEERRTELRQIPDFERTGSAFISHQASDLAAPRVQELKAQGVPVLCWTIRSSSSEAEARQVADNITFEGYPA
ncbi:MAG: glycerophosphodiester phosphodiesterase family protein [Pseudomonadota bacterium]